MRNFFGSPQRIAATIGLAVILAAVAYPPSFAWVVGQLTQAIAFGLGAAQPLEGLVILVAIIVVAFRMILSPMFSRPREPRRRRRE